MIEEPTIVPCGVFTGIVDAKLEFNYRVKLTELAGDPFIFLPWSRRKDYQPGDTVTVEVTHVTRKVGKYLMTSARGEFLP